MSVEAPDLLLKLFHRHFEDPVAAVQRFRQRLAKAKLDFDAVIQEKNFSPEVGFLSRMPSFIYYFLPGSRFSSGKKTPKGPDDPAHIDSSDGIGLNMGCPVRLLRALDVLFSLPEADQREPLCQVRNVKNHFAAIEELLWLTLWRQQTELGRGGELVPTKNKDKGRDVDWFFFSDGVSGGTKVVEKRRFEIPFSSR